MSLRDPGQIQKIRDCPGDSGTVGAYVNTTMKKKSGPPGLVDPWPTNPRTGGPRGSTCPRTSGLPPELVDPPWLHIHFLSIAPRVLVSAFEPTTKR